MTLYDPDAIAAVQSPFGLRLACAVHVMQPLFFRFDVMICFALGLLASSQSSPTQQACRAPQCSASSAVTVSPDPRRAAALAAVGMEVLRNAGDVVRVTCPVGYAASGAGADAVCWLGTLHPDVECCGDVNECSLGIHNCHRHGNCQNTAGSFTCTCGAGFIGDGLACFQTNTSVAQVDLAGIHTCALYLSGGVKCWGRNSDYGRLGDATGIDRRTPTTVARLNQSLSLVSAKEAHSCVLQLSGGVMCWGMNSNGQVGNGGTASAFEPVAVQNLSTGVSSVVTGGAHTCALMSTGEVRCWGSNANGQLGDGTTTSRGSPMTVVGLSRGVRVIAAGYFHNCAVLLAGDVTCWGLNDAGQLGDGTTSTRLTPQNVTSLLGVVISAIALGQRHSCVLLAQGEVKCWGDNTFGQLGDGSVISRSSPTAASGFQGSVSSIALGYVHTCAVCSPGNVQCWGNNEARQLGDGTLTNRNRPTNVTGLRSRALAVSAGYRHTCALLDTRTLQCWGMNSSGQLGDGTTIDRATPTDVLS